MDLNAVPTASLASYTEQEDGSVEVQYGIRDDENNPVTLHVYYSEDGGGTWFPATVNEDLTDLAPARYQGTFTWERLRDVPTIVPGSSIKLRAVPYDEDEGQGSDLSLTLTTPGGE